MPTYATKAHVPVSVWSDIACPWCFVGKAHLDAAIDELATKAPGVDVSVRWHAFELDPTPRAPSTENYVDRLARKYGRSAGEAQQMIDTMAARIRAAGGQADFERLVPANTFDAHRLIQWAGATDRDGVTERAQSQLTDAFMRGYLGDGLDLSSVAAMVALVEAIGLDHMAARAVLESEQLGDVVRADEQTAAEYGISGVPFFAIGRYGVSGAQPTTTLVEAILRAAAEPPIDSGKTK